MRSINTNNIYQVRFIKSDLIELLQEVRDFMMEPNGDKWGHKNSHSVLTPLVIYYDTEFGYCCDFQMGEPVK